MGCQSSKLEATHASTVPATGQKRNKAAAPSPKPLMSSEDRQATKKILDHQFQVDASFVIHFSHVKAKMHQKLLQARDTLSEKSQQHSKDNKPVNTSTIGSKVKNPRISFTQHSLQKPEQHLSREDKIIQGVKLLEERLANFQMEQCPMKDDGNCQFRAMAHQLFGNADAFHQSTRRACVQWLRDHADEFSFFFESAHEWERYLATMEQLGTWGDELTLKAASNVYQCTVHVVTSEQEHYYVRYEPDHPAPSESHESPVPGCQDIFLAYISPIHYNSIRLLKKQQS